MQSCSVDEFVQMLFTFPVEPGAATRQEQLEIISDSVYANSSTLDGRRFAEEFYTKRKADAQAKLTGGASTGAAKTNSMADSESMKYAFECFYSLTSLSGSPQNPAQGCHQRLWRLQSRQGQGKEEVDPLLTTQKTCCIFFCISL